VSLLESVAAWWGAVLASFIALPSQPAELVAVAAIAATAVLAVAVTVRLLPRARLVLGHRAALPAAARRDRVRRRSVPRLCDPAARGRRRPRAPSALRSAA
jgi:hypothetical protein